MGLIPSVAEVSTHLKKKAPLAAAILLGVVLGATLGFMPIAAMAVAGAVSMVLVGIVPLKEVYRVIDWRTLILIGGICTRLASRSTTPARRT